MANRCMICGKDTVQTGGLTRINDYGVTGVWACHDHAAQALRTFAAAKGCDAVRPDLRKHVDPAMQVQKWPKCG